MEELQPEELEEAIPWCFARAIYGAVLAQAARWSSTDERASS